MLNLTRLRRRVRDGFYPELFELLDTLDKCFEHLEEAEEAIKGYNELDIEQLHGYLMACIVELSGTLAGMRDYETSETVIERFVQTKGYAVVAELVENKKPVDVSMELGEIEDHPF